MDWNLKKMWPAAAASLVEFTSILNTADDAQVRNLENRVCTLEKTRDCGCMVNPPGRPEIKCGYNVFVDAELLWWSAYETGLDWVVESKQYGREINNHAVLANGKTHEVDNTYDWGFRFGVGYNMPHDGWDIVGYWTFFQNEWEDSKHQAHDGFLAPIWNNPDTNAFVQPANLVLNQASASWKLDMNIIDVELGREFFVSKYLTLRPHMGFRYARLDQDWKVSYAGINDVAPDKGRNYKDDINNSNDFWGFGLRGGLNTSWGFGQGFSIYGNLAAALLHGHFHISDQDNLVDVGTHQRFVRLKNDHRFRAGRATTDLALGIRWDHMFDGERFHLGVQLGWEHHMFWGQNQMWQYVNGTPGNEARHSRGNDELTTQGWTLAARFDF
jgi:hypothetical protein